MSRKVLRFLLIVPLLGFAHIGLLGDSLVTPAYAQFWGGPGGGGGGFFGGWFGGGPRYAPRYYERAPREHEYSRPESQGDFSHAPPPRKETKSDVAPTTSILVMGDGMADWLAYGLEDAFADTPEVAIVRKDRPNSGLLRYDVKGDLDWWHVARDILAQEKPSYIVMMLGVTDRQNIRERDLAKEAEKEAKEEEAKEKAAKEQAAKEQAAKEQAAKQQDAPEQGEKTADSDSKAAQKDNSPSEQPPAATEEKKPKRPVVTGSLEFRSEQWERVYIHRIDDTIAALKSKGVPVFWVGLPAIKGAKSTADTSYLNNLYRTRAQRAGIVYIDVWDGFVDDNGRYTSFGPDYEGQQRRLRSADGVYFNTYGARKLAHYVEREIRRYMSNRVVSLPTQPAAPAAPASGKSSERPLAGPVVPLSTVSANSDDLLGGASAGRVHGDALATQVLVKGEPIHPQPGRADDFAWPAGNAPRPAAAAQPAKPNAPAKTVASAPSQLSPAPPPAAPVATAPAPAAAAPPPPPIANVAPPTAPAVPDAAPPVSISPQPESNSAAPDEALEPKDEPQKSAKPKRAEPKAKPAPPRHEASAPRPPRDLQPPPQRRPSDPLRELFGVFR